MPGSIILKMALSLWCRPNGSTIVIYHDNPGQTAFRAAPAFILQLDQLEAMLCDSNTKK